MEKKRILFTCHHGDFSERQSRWFKEKLKAAGHSEYDVDWTPMSAPSHAFDEQRVLNADHTVVAWKTNHQEIQGILKKSKA